MVQSSGAGAPHPTFPTSQPAPSPSSSPEGGVAAPPARSPPPLAVVGGTSVRMGSATASALAWS